MRASSTMRRLSLFNLFLLAFANLIAHSAGCLAGRLAGCLAFAATAGFKGLLHGGLVYCCDMLHFSVLLCNTTIILFVSMAKRKLFCNFATIMSEKFHQGATICSLRSQKVTCRSPTVSMKSNAALKFAPIASAVWASEPMVTYFPPISL